LSLSLVLAPLAHADCKGDLEILKARLDASDAKKPNVGAAKKEMLKAEEAQKDEVACDDAVSRAWRAYRKPPPAPVADDADKN
jgi:hypothetical protein